MPVFAVQYEYAENSESARDLHRPAHREFLRTEHGPVAALATGPYADEPAGALLIFRGPSLEEVESALDTDPFALQGVISRREVREWAQAIGPWAT